MATTAAFQCATAPNVVFKSREELHEHYKSEWHRYNLRRRAAGLAPINKDVFDKVRQMAANQEKQQSESARQKKQDHVKNKEALERASSGKRTVDEDGEVGSGNDSTTMTMQEKVAKAIQAFEPNPSRCILDGHVSDNIESNLAHMHKEHGLVIHDLASVKDLSGLINYIAEKVHVGRICLTCEREFRSSAACIAHMTSKGHCSIPWEFEDDIEEYAEYYDFSSSIKEGGADGMETMQVDEVTGELILSNADGTVKRIGPSKEFRSVYRAIKEENRAIDPAIANAVKERSLQVYQRYGLSTSTALSTEVKMKLMKRMNVIQTRSERKYQDFALKGGLTQNWLIKDRKAGTNVGAGHGVHG